MFKKKKEKIEEIQVVDYGMDKFEIHKKKKGSKTITTIILGSSVVIAEEFHSCMITEDKSYPCLILQYKDLVGDDLRLKTYKNVEKKFEFLRDNLFSK
jgi:hypothetical protein